MMIPIDFPDDNINEIFEMIRADDLRRWPYTRQQIEGEMEDRIRDHGDGLAWFEDAIIKAVKKELVQRCHNAAASDKRRARMGAQ